MMDGGLLSLPIAPRVALEHVIAPALATLPARMNSTAARVMLLAIALQESGLRARVQSGGGPARGLWQFERGGCAGVLRHEASRDLAHSLCEEAGVEPSASALHAALMFDDLLAARMARLLLWTDPAPLPTDEFGGWRLYLRTWRPGHPRPHDWPEHFATARDVVVPG